MFDANASVSRFVSGEYALRAVASCFTVVRDDELVTLVVEGYAGSGEVEITCLRHDIPGGGGPEWTGELTEPEERSARQALDEAACDADAMDREAARRCSTYPEELSDRYWKCAPCAAEMA